MGISEKKMQIVINNYFKQECDVNTSIREAFEKGFRIGVKKGQSAQPEIIRCKNCKYWVVEEDEAYCYRIVMVHGAKDGSGFCSDAERKMDNDRTD